MARNNRPGSDLVNQYINEVLAPTLADKKGVKAARFTVTELSSLIPVVGTVVSAADTFFVDKLLTGWKPNHFIDGKLKPMLSTKS